MAKPRLPKTISNVTLGYLDPGEWSAGFGQSFRNLFVHDLANHGRLFHKGGEIRKHTHSGGIVSARNEIAQAFVDDSNSEWLCFIDTDMGFAPTIIDDLIDSAESANAGIMGALCFAYMQEGIRDLYAISSRIIPTVYQWFDTEIGSGFSPILDYPIDTITQVSGTGSACIVIHRRVIEKMRAHLGGDSWYHPVTHPTAGPDKTPREFSEDLSFCVKAAQIGEPVYVNTALKTTHHKGHVALDEYLYIAERISRGEIERP